MKKNINYGMFEAPNEKKATPIVSLNLFFDIYTIGFVKAFEKFSK